MQKGLRCFVIKFYKAQVAHEGWFVEVIDYDLDFTGVYDFKL